MTRVVIAGGGIAGLEALIALRGHLGPEPRIDVLEPSMELVERQRAVAEPFGAAAPPRFDLARIASDHGAVLAPDRLKAVDAGAHRVHTVRGDTIDYDALLVAVGAQPEIALPGALTFTGPRDVEAYRKLLGAVGTGRVHHVAFAVPAGIAWSLPLYELALLTAEHIRLGGLDDVSLVLVTPEQSALDGFGATIASRMGELLARSGIDLRTGTTPRRVVAGGLVVEGGEVVQAEWIVALPELRGPWIAGLPHDADGFIPTDEHGAVPGADAVWAAGDGTAFPIKQGGIAALQADAAAAAIAASLGAAVEPLAFAPVLHALLAVPHGERVLESDAGEPTAEEPWWPASKVAARHLAPYLATIDSIEPGPDHQIDVGRLLLALGERHGHAGDSAMARRCRDAAAQLERQASAAGTRRRHEAAAR